MLSGDLVGTIPVWCWVRSNIPEGIPSHRDSAFVSQKFENMTGRVMLIAFRATEGNKDRNRRSGDRRNGFQPLADIGGGIIIKYRRADDDEVLICKAVFYESHHQ